MAFNTDIQNQYRPEQRDVVGNYILHFAYFEYNLRRITCFTSRSNEEAWWNDDTNRRLTAGQCQQRVSARLDSALGEDDRATFDDIARRTEEQIAFRNLLVHGVWLSQAYIAGSESEVALARPFMEHEYQPAPAAPREMVPSEITRRTEELHTLFWDLLRFWQGPGKTYFRNSAP